MASASTGDSCCPPTEDSDTAPLSSSSSAAAAAAAATVAAPEGAETEGSASASASAAAPAGEAGTTRGGKSTKRKSAEVDEAASASPSAAAAGAGAGAGAGAAPASKKTRRQTIREDFSEAVKSQVIQEQKSHCGLCRCQADNPQAAHIYPARRNTGPRADPGVEPEFIKSAENCIYLCMPCHKHIDKHYDIFTAELLLKIKGWQGREPTVAYGWINSDDLFRRFRDAPDHTFETFKAILEERRVDEGRHSNGPFIGRQQAPNIVNVGIPPANTRGIGEQNATEKVLNWFG